MARTSVRRSVGANIYFTAATGTVPAVDTVVPFDNISIDDVSGFTGAGTTSLIYTVRVAGEYLVSGCMAANSAGAGTYVARIYAKDVIVTVGVMAVQAATVNGVAAIPSRLVRLDVGDTIYMTDISGSGTWTRAGGQNANFLSIVLQESN